MRLSWQEIDDMQNPYGGGVFRGDVLNTPSLDWRSRLPDIVSLRKTAAADPAIVASFEESYGKSLNSIASPINPLMKFIGDLAMADFIDGTRQTLGVTVQTSGILSSNMGNVGKIFATNRNDVLKGFDVAGMVLESKSFELALNTIGAIPIAGWVIKIIYEIAKAVAGIIIATKDQSDAAARRAIAKSLTIPMDALQFNASTDDIQTKAFFKLIGPANYDPMRVITPSYKMSPNRPNMGFEAQGVYNNQGDDKASGWIVYGNPDDFTGGLGFVPGTTSITRSIFFNAGVTSSPNSCGVGCASGNMRDLGTLYPTAQNLCTSWWSQVTSPGPSLYTIEPLKLKSVWQDYISRMLVLCMNVAKGWTCAPTGTPFTDKFECISPDLTCGMGDDKREKGMGSCEHKRRGDELTIPADFGRSSHLMFYGYLMELFFGIKDPYATKKGGIEKQAPTLNQAEYGSPAWTYTANNSSKPWWRPNAFDYDKSVPVEALQNAYDRQKSVLKSIKCMYVNGRDKETFPAFRDSNLKKLWEQSVTAILNSNDWKRVVYADIPEGDAKNAFRQVALSKGVKESDLENFNRPCAPGESKASGCGNTAPLGLAYAAPSILGDPKPPAPPPINGIVIGKLISKRLPKRASTKTPIKKSSSALPLVLAAGVIGFMMLRGKK